MEKSKIYGIIVKSYYKGEILVKEVYLACLKKLKEFRKSLLSDIDIKRGNVIWIDFGFNIGNEFGGMHPAVILKNFDKDLFVLPVSSKKPIEYERIERELENKNITKEECNKRKNKITEIVQLDNIVGFKAMTRWANITRMRKVSILRLNFSGTIGRIDGKYMSIISKKISEEF